MSIRKIGLYMLMSVLLAGCAQHDNDEDDQPQETVKHVWSGQVKAMDRARGVEQTIAESAQRQKREIDEQTQ